MCTRRCQKNKPIINVYYTFYIYFQYLKFIIFTESSSKINCGDFQPKTLLSLERFRLFYVLSLS